jgi:hypothetical protein
MPRLGLGGLRPLDPCRTVTTRWSVYSAKCLATFTHSLYHSMKPNIPHSNLRQGEPYYAGYHFGAEQVPGPTMSFSPHLPEADPNQDAFHSSCWASQAEDDEVHQTYGNDGYGRSISGYGSNHAMAGGTCEIPAPQPLQKGDYSMVSVFHQCLATTIHSFYHSMKPSIPYSNLKQGEPCYTGSHSGTGQVPGPTMSFSPALPVAGPSQDASSEWRFHTCWVSHAEDDEIHLTIALKKS